MILRIAIVLLLGNTAITVAQSPRWEAVELPTKLTVGYAVRAIDMNRDKKLDIAIVDSKRVLWLENPSWKEHVIYSTPDAKADNVCFAPLDIDGDGLLDLALGADWQPNNTDSGGSIGWLQQIGEGEWKYHPLASEPTTHRMNWMELVRDRPSLIVAPLKGPNSRAPGFEQTGVKLLALTPDRTAATASWDLRVLTDQLHVMHNFQVTDLDQDGQPDLVCASYEGATWLQFDEGGAVRRTTRIGTGQEQTPPARGASEIRVGHLANKRPFVATIEPWHGDKVVVYVAPADWNAKQPGEKAWPRFVIDDELAWGHAVACSNLDDDAEDEIVIGVRDNKSDTHRCGVRIYNVASDEGDKWTREVIHPGQVAVEDLVTADLDGDGRNDIIAVGRATHNVVVYWNR